MGRQRRKRIVESLGMEEILYIYIYVMYFSSFVFDDPRIYLSGIVLRGAESRTANIKSIENHSNQRGNKVG